MKSYTDLEQSKKLAEFLPLKSADMYYPIEGASPKFGIALSISTNIPCWSLAALLNILPNSIYDNTDEYSQIEFTKRSVAYHDMNDGIKVGSIKENLVDAAYKVILKLHELNLL